MSEQKVMTAVEMGRKGGKARQASMSPEQKIQMLKRLTRARQRARKRRGTWFKPETLEAINRRKAG